MTGFGARSIGGRGSQTSGTATVVKVVAGDKVTAGEALATVGPTALESAATGWHARLRLESGGRGVLSILLSTGIRQWLL